MSNTSSASSKFRAVIFDLDGTLLDTLQDICDSVNVILQKYQFPGRLPSQIRTYLGNGAGNLMACSLPQGKDTPGFDAILQEYVQYYEAHCEIRTGPYPGIPAMLSQLKRAGLRMAIVSNKGDGAVRELAKRHFSATIETAVGEREGIRRKPSPDSVLEAMRQLGSDPLHTLYVGDSEVDYHTARNAGLPCALVTWGFRDRDVLASLQPDFLVDTPEALVQILMGASI